MGNEIEAPVLLVGGYGALGSHAAHTLRHLHPNLPLIIAGRNAEQADALARTLGNAEAVAADLAKEDLGLDRRRRVSAVAMFAKDQYLHGARFAAANGVPYLSVSEYAVEIAPIVACLSSISQPAPALLLGHHLGGLVTMATLGFAREFDNVHSIEIGAIFDADDLGSPTAQADADRVARAAPHPLVLLGGKWTWAEPNLAARRFSSSDGVEFMGSSISLLDVVSLAAATQAETVRFDVALRNEIGTNPGRRHEVIIEIVGKEPGGAVSRRRYLIADDEFHTRMSGQSAALALETLIGLVGRETPPAGPRFPENLLESDHITQQMRRFGARIEMLPE